MNGLPPDFASIVRLHLRWGADAAVRISDLAEDLRVPRRVIEQAVSDLRMAGEPVCTGPMGVHLSDSAAELRAAYRSLRRRYISQAIGARALLRTAGRFEKAGQTMLPWADLAAGRRGSFEPGFPEVRSLTVVSPDGEVVARFLRAHGRGDAA